MKDLGIRVALISGSIDILVEKVADQLGIELWQSNAAPNFNEDDTFQELTCLDDEAVAKKKILDSICERYGVTLSDVISVGDGASDAELFTVTRGITFEGCSIASQAWRVVGSIRDVCATIKEA